jgi:hypothetical protein
MLYDLATNQYFIKPNLKQIEKKQPCPNLHEFDSDLVSAARNLPNQWVGPSLGDALAVDAPVYLNTNIVTIHQQHSDPFCLTHSLASALFYCGFKIGGEGLVSLGKTIWNKHAEEQLSRVRNYMEEHVPLIGRVTLFGIRPHSHTRKMRRMTWDDLLMKVTPYPTLVVPVLPTGAATHAFCVVDDLIFDSTTQFALKLCMDSVIWLFQEEFPEIYHVLRFDQKVSPKGFKIWERYERDIKYHWNHPSRPISSLSD